MTSDGGFFVFGDLSVKIEGDYCLRFSLFEMLKTEVVFIKSITSAPFTGQDTPLSGEDVRTHKILVYSPKSFPGMAESTFLSRSFGDQGVRLRIRKEPRTLLKRPASSGLRSDEFPPALEDPPPPAQRDIPLQSQRPQISTYGTRYTGLGDPSAKRQRTSVDMGERSVVDPDRYSQRSYTDQRAPFGTYAASHQLANSFAPTYSQGPPSALSNLSDFSFGHQRTNSSNTSSPFVSPHTDFSGHSWPTSNNYYQAAAKDPLYTYSQSQYPDMQPPRQPQLAEPFVRQRVQDLSGRLQINSNLSFPRPLDSESSAAESYNQATRPLPMASSYTDPSPRLPSTDQIGDLAASSRQQYPSAPLSNVLPPLESTAGSSQSQGAQQGLTSNILPSIEPSNLLSGQPMQESGTEGYDSSSFNFPLPNHKRQEDGQETSR
ncbi:MAG: hypothetical protein Q9179_004879 [Wetmoreana sp. 5 TL-2023]